MGKYSFWMVKVVLHSWGIALLFILGDARAQSPAGTARKLSVSYRHAYLEDVLQHLSSEAGVYFVYSVHVLEPRVPAVSLTVHQQPLDEVLDFLGRQHHLTFRREGKYIIIKKAAVVKKPAAVSLRPTPMPVTDPPDVPVTRAAPAGEEQLALVPSVHATSLYSSLIPGQRLITNPFQAGMEKARRGPQWFVSGGVFANDFTYGGVELQGGLRHAYIVLNAGLLEGTAYRFGYGAGTAVSLNRRWDLQLTYTFARVQQKDDIKFIGRVGNGVIMRDNTLRVNLRHQQVKLMAHYRISPRVDFLLGPTANFINARYTYSTLAEVSQWRSFFVSADPRYAMAAKDTAPFQPGGKPEYPNKPGQASLFTEKSFSTTCFRLGFEVGLSYRINFLRYR